MAKIAYVVDEVKDNVATIISNEVTQGVAVPFVLQGKSMKVVANTDIPYGHKIAIKPMQKGETVYKYGLSIGKAMQDIQVGDHVHVQNIEPCRGRGDLAAQAKGCGC